MNTHRSIPMGGAYVSFSGELLQVFSMWFVVVFLVFLLCVNYMQSHRYRTRTSFSPGPTCYMSSSISFSSTSSSSSSSLSSISPSAPPLLFLFLLFLLLLLCFFLLLSMSFLFVHRVYLCKKAFQLILAWIVPALLCLRYTHSFFLQNAHPTICLVVSTGIGGYS